MSKEQTLEILRQHAAELRAAGVEHMHLFGSVARDEATPSSDVDLLVDFDKSMRLTLITLGGLESRLGDLLGTRVELSSADWMRQPIRDQALREAILAF